MSFRPATGSTYTRDAAAAAAASVFRYEDDEGTHFTYTPAYEAATEGGGQAADARAGFAPGYYSVPDAGLQRTREAAATGGGVQGPRLRVNDFPQRWSKVEDHAQWRSSSSPRHGEEWDSQENAHARAAAAAAAAAMPGGQGEASGRREAEALRAAATASRREYAAQQAGAEWRAQEQANAEASEASAAEAESAAQAVREAQEAYDLQIALQLSAASAQGNDPDAQLLAELEIADARRAARSAPGGIRGGGGGGGGGGKGACASDPTSPLGRTRGQALAARYWISLCLDADEELDGACDGFYDLWGDFSDLEVREGGRCPSLVALLAAGGTDPQGEPREALLVDRRTDACLSERVKLLDAEVASGDVLSRSAEARAAFLARHVASALGGAQGPGDMPVLRAAVQEAVASLRCASGGCVLRLGDLPLGLARHRALLFKALAPHLRLRCRLVRGAYYCEGEEEAAAVVLVTEGGLEYTVDLVTSPGQLQAPLGFVAPQEEGLGARAREGLPNEPPQDAEAPYPSQHARSAARPARPGAPSSAAAHRADAFPPPPSFDPAAFEGADGEDEDVAVAELMSAYGCTAELAFEALIQADYSLSRAHLLCQGSAILGASVRELYDLLVLNGWNLQSAVQVQMEVMDQATRGSEERERGRREAMRQQSASAASSSAGSAPPAAAQQPRGGPQNWAGPGTAQADPDSTRRAPRSSSSAGSSAAGGSDDRVRSLAAARLTELRARDAAAAADASSADAHRRAFHAEWDRKLEHLDLPNTLRALGVPLQPGPNPSPQALRKAYRLAVMRFHPDRQRHSSLAERVKAEEAFKVISQKSEAYHA